MTFKDVYILKDAANDLEEGKTFYDQQELGVGDYFWDSVLADMESLMIHAGIHKKSNALHQMLAKRFPYVIYYEIKNDIVYVVAVLPMRRNPVWIIKKLEERS
ncbi:MAG: type II toxin-antitoxin system RelE/ParE family toxin [Desulfamplus sp.]|nr:type II toxin-antitoxin system RelE/ParE family toxin [Desulfamplus sp.]